MMWLASSRRPSSFGQPWVEIGVFSESGEAGYRNPRRQIKEIVICGSHRLPSIRKRPRRVCMAETERVVSYLTEELVRQGHDVTLFASGDFGD